jgi:hypothetical protein
VARIFGLPRMAYTERQGADEPRIEGEVGPPSREQPFRKFVPRKSRDRDAGVVVAELTIGRSRSAEPGSSGELGRARALLPRMCEPLRSEMARGKRNRYTIDRCVIDRALCIRCTNAVSS